MQLTLGADRPLQLRGLRSVAITTARPNRTSRRRLRLPRRHQRGPPQRSISAGGHGVLGSPRRGISSQQNGSALLTLLLTTYELARRIIRHPPCRQEPRSLRSLSSKSSSAAPGWRRKLFGLPFSGGAEGSGRRNPPTLALRILVRAGGTLGRDGVAVPRRGQGQQDGRGGSQCAREQPDRRRAASPRLGRAQPAGLGVRDTLPLSQRPGGA